MIGFEKSYGQEMLYNFRHYSKKEGLLAQKIRDVVEDSRGILWMATDKGLVNFDGIRFHNIPFHRTYSHLTNDLSSISLDPKSSKIWMTSYNQGLICYDTHLPISSSVRTFNPTIGHNKIVKNELYTVFVASSGIVYFGGQETGLQYYDPKTDDVSYIKLSNSKDLETIFSIREDGNGIIWIGTRYGGIYIYNPKSNDIDNINLNNKGENGGRHFTFVGDSVYLNYYDYNLSNLGIYDKKIEHTNLLGIGKNKDYYDNELTDICYLPQQEKLLLAHIVHGLYLYDIRTKTNKHISWKEIYPEIDIETRINSLTSTSNGIYIATNQGLFLYSDELNIVDDLIPLNFSIKELFKVGNDTWFISATSVGKLSADYKNILLQIPTNELKVSQVNVVNNQIYLSTYGNGVHLVHTSTKSIQPLPINGKDFNFREADCNTVLGDVINSQDYLWIGSWNSGLYKYNLISREITLFNKQTGLIDNKIITVGKDRNNSIWLGMDGFGAVRVVDKVKGKFFSYFHHPADSLSLNANSVFSFLLDRYNELWYGSSTSGIGKIHFASKPEFIHYNDPHPFKKLYTRKMAMDHLDRIWMQTSDGVMIFDKISKRFLHLEQGDGVYPSVLNSPTDFYLNNNDIIWITNKGLIKGEISKVKVFEPDDYTSIISQFRILNEDHSYKLQSSTITLQPSENSFAFYLACPQLVKNSNIRFSYQLDGIHKEWIETDESHQAIFTNVDPGRYTFSVRVGDMEGNWSKNITKYNIVVKSVWYESTLFRVLFALILATLAFGFLFYRINQQKAVNKLHSDFNEKLKKELIENEKKIIEQQENLEVQRQEKIESDFRKKLYESELKAVRAQMNPHFIFNVLNSIEAYVVENNKLKASKLIHKFASLSRIVLENSQNSMVNIESELGLVKLYLDLERERFDHMFDFEIHVENDINPYRDKIPSMLIQPIVENAVHHGVRHLTDRKGLVYINISRRDVYIVIQVLDNGVGFDLQENSTFKRQSFGIKGVENRLQMMNRDGVNSRTGIHIDKTPNILDYTTRVTMIFPIF
ncbi:histidine kinase [Sphingobacterium sp. WQ 366]|uniref:Histidine kinase n=1 Tax=Sphingobacterium bovistauri TaxID=2781959 RepID=A0ABS7Z6H8_9SPHI|nr:histidine kinase [Sphingobacterium bovistauri]